MAALVVGGPEAGATAAQSGDSPLALDGRSRVEVRLGASNLDVTHDDRRDALDVTGAGVSLALVHWASEHLAFDLALGATNIDVSRRRSFRGETVRTEALYSILAGARVYLPVPGAFRPHLDVALGLLTEIEVDDRPRGAHLGGGPARAGLEVGGGVDFLLGRHFVFGVRAAVLLREGHRGQLSVDGGVGWTFGGGR